ncbi:MAG: NYN domain-containing protein [Patescibacteria group bacterium]|jgi:uncharacterized LabA/DUF88 family protein
MDKTILFIDGENFRYKVDEVLGKEGINKDQIDFATINLKKLMGRVLKRTRLSRKLFYAARMREHEATPEKSKELISMQRRLKTNIEKQGFTYTRAGNVRAQTVRVGGEEELVFREKGVDVKIAVDMVSLAYRKQMDTAIICSSDSDLQPAIAELKKVQVKVVYLGFQNNPNKGLMYTADEIILFRNSEIVEAFSVSKSKPSKSAS